MENNDWEEAYKKLLVHRGIEISGHGILVIRDFIRETRLSAFQEGLVAGRLETKRKELPKEGSLPRNRMPLYRRWSAMKKRCYNPNFKGSQYWQGRGITVCERWHSFDNFREDMGATYFPHASLERIDNDKGYSPENCKWIERGEQSKNRRCVELFTYDGESLSAAEWSRRQGFSKDVVSRRLRNGWTWEEAIFTPTSNQVYLPINSRIEESKKGA